MMPRARRSPPRRAWRRTAAAKGSNAAAAKAVGALIAKKAKRQGRTRVVFDRGGYLYHGNIKALADAARENGLEF